MSIILYLLKEQRISQKELCERIGIKQQVFTDWKAGRNKSYSKYLSQIANCLNVSVDHLLGKEHSLHITPSQKSQNDIDTVIESIRLDGITAMCPVYDSVSAGYGALAEDCIIGYMPTFVTSNEEAKYLFWVNVKGDSMLPKIENGDKILIQKQTTVDNSAVAVVLINNEDAVVKRVFYGPDWVELRSFNSDYPIRKFTGSDVQQITIIGKVKEVSKRFD